ncbi:hypothetical protein Rhsp01_39080 [Rhizobium sp. NBRC 114257]|uniref:Uncharacterized protein n=1 Tax=Rhizobium dioscoreae TaxID=2653122 RepID=A0ABQ0Z728_9HYPH|nr:hypothetical protein RsS93_38940 [Rhizobium dioscoreae]GLU82732.1 hypothetical protein Rhsp01_39080 [Rhizobium sp. NBRC 114257]
MEKVLPTKAEKDARNFMESPGGRSMMMFGRSKPGASRVKASNRPIRSLPSSKQHQSTEGRGKFALQGATA